MVQTLVRTVRTNRLWLLLVVFISSSLLAQPAPAPTRPTPKVDITGMASQAAALDKESTANIKLVVILQMQARRAKDVIRLNCINDKLIQLKPLRNLLDTHLGTFDNATSSTEQSAAIQNITETASNIRTLRDEARTCAGEYQLVSDMRNNWDGPDIPDDPGKNWFPPSLEPPGYASPYN